MPDAPDRIEGAITKYVEERDFGFLTTVNIEKGGLTDVFFHITEVYDHDRVNEKWRFECTPSYNQHEGGCEPLEARVISKETDRGSSESRRKPWCRRDSASEVDEQVDGYGEVVMERKQGRSGSAEDDDRVRYDPSDYV